MLYSKSLSFPPQKLFLKNYHFPHSANIPPKKSKLLCPTSLHWKPGKEGLNESPGTLAGGQGPRVFTWKSCFRRPEIRFKSSFSMVMKVYKMLQRVEFRWYSYFILSTMIFSWRGFSEESRIFYRVSCLSKAIEYYIELSKKGSNVIWIWFGYLKKHKFDQTFLYMKYNLKHITSGKKIEAIQMLWFKIASSSHWLRNVICHVMTLQTTEHGLIDLKGDFNDLT